VGQAQEASTWPGIDSSDPVPDLRTVDGFTAWIEPHWAAMAYLAARAGDDRDDILQEALSAAWRKRAQFDPSRGTARNWLLAITADQRWKARRTAARLFANRSPQQLVPLPPEDDRTARVDMERAVCRLPSRQRLAVELHYYLDLPIADVAQVMRCADGTVKSTLSDARARLRTLLGEDYL